MTEKEIARITGLVMAVLLAIASLVGIVVTPEDAEALGVVVTGLVTVFIALGGVEFIRSKVASRGTVRKEVGTEGERKIFG